MKLTASHHAIGFVIVLPLLILLTNRVGWNEPLSLSDPVSWCATCLTSLCISSAVSAIASLGLYGPGFPSVMTLQDGLRVYLFILSVGVLMFLLISAMGRGYGPWLMSWNFVIFICEIPRWYKLAFGQKTDPKFVMLQPETAHCMKWYG